MRKIIYIGQGCQQSVYYNTRTREALATESSASSETDGAISSKKSKWPWVVFFAFLLVAIIGIWIRSLIAPYYEHEWFEPSMFMVPIGATIVPISVVLLLFQNNPIRWLLAVRKYKQGKVLFREEKN